jgi:hypothetical protein
MIYILEIEVNVMAKKTIKRRSSEALSLTLKIFSPKKINSKKVYSRKKRAKEDFAL